MATSAHFALGLTRNMRRLSSVVLTNNGHSSSAGLLNRSCFRGWESGCSSNTSLENFVRIFSTRSLSSTFSPIPFATSKANNLCLVHMQQGRIPMSTERESALLHTLTSIGDGRYLVGRLTSKEDSTRSFSTSSSNAGRHKKTPFEGSESQSYFGIQPRNSKKRRSSIGPLQLNNSLNYLKKRIQLKETRLKVSKRLNIIRNRFQVHNRNFHENFKYQSQRAEKRLRRPLVTKRENISTIPNLLTTLRMASAPLLSYLVVNEYFGCAFSIFVLAGLTDVLDGYIARTFPNQRTAFGTALDPMADKVLMCFLTISLTMADLIPVPLTVLILGRDAGLIIASFYIRYISLSPPRTLARYFDFSHVTGKFYPSNISKINTGFQLTFVACTLASPVFDFVGSPWLQLLMYSTAATTFLSGADYMVTWRRRLKIIKNN